MELLPTYGEWVVEMRKVDASVDMQTDGEEMAQLYSIVSTILRGHLEMDPHIDYDDCFRAKGCAREIFTMSIRRKLAAIAYMNTLRNSHDPVTRLMGQSILRELKNIYDTGIVPKTYRELQREEWEKERGDK